MLSGKYMEMASMTKLHDFISRHDMLYGAAFPFLALRRNWLEHKKRVFYEKLRQDLSSETIVKFKDFHMSLDPTSAHDLQLFVLYKQGRLFEPGLSTILSIVLKRGMTFVDIGANNGYFTLFASQLVGSEGMVYSVEPSERNFRRLKNNLLINSISNVFPFMKAVSDHTGTATFYLSDYEDGLDSLERYPSHTKASAVEVDSLDRLLPNAKVDFMKVDVEGFEVETLIGAEQILSSNESIFLSVEYNKNLVHRRKIGYDALFDKLLDSNFLIREILETEQNTGYSYTRPLVSIKNVYSHSDMTTGFANLLCFRKCNLHFVERMLI